LRQRAAPQLRRFFFGAISYVEDRLYLIEEKLRGCLLLSSWGERYAILSIRHESLLGFFSFWRLRRFDIGKTNDEKAALFRVCDPRQAHFGGTLAMLFRNEQVEKHDITRQTQGPQQLDQDDLVRMTDGATCSCDQIHVAGAYELWLLHGFDVEQAAFAAWVLGGRPRPIDPED
jgi:hypothetical protein